MSIVSCSSLEKSSKEHEQKTVDLLVLDPGHFHASLLQKDTISAINDTIRVFAPEGEEVIQYEKSIDLYNSRTANPTSWVKQLYIGDDYLSKMGECRKGSVVVLAGNNKKKTHYISEAIKKGFHVLSDKPLAINKTDFNQLLEAYKLAEKNDLLIFDLMTERYEMLNVIERELLNESSLFGKLKKGSEEEPAVSMASTHHFFKTVSGVPLRRPVWYYDVEQQGEGIADVTTHLIDLITWQCFPDEAIHYATDVRVNSSKHWCTPITLDQFTKSTQCDSFPVCLKKYVKNDVLGVMANGEINFSVKGTHVRIKVIWDYEAPEDGGDTFVSVKKGTLSEIKIVQDRESKFTRQLYIQKNDEIDLHSFKTELDKVINKLKKSYPFITVVEKNTGLYLIDIPLQNRSGHEEHFSEVVKSFLQYLSEKNMPEWENENTITKYFITTTAVDIAQ